MTSASGLLLPSNIEPYYLDEQSGIVIYNADCRDVLPGLSEAEGLTDVALVLTDPPYGIYLSDHKPGIDRRKASITGDENGDVGRYVLDLCCDTPTIAFASPMRAWPGEWRQFLVWDKGPAVGGGGDIATCWKFSWELIQTARLSRLNGIRDCSVLRFWITPQDADLHPAQKPVKLIRYLVGKATMPGDLILDPFIGSGTTLVAAKQLGRRAIGIEIERKYCDIAIERLRQDVLPLEAVVSEQAEQLRLTV